MNAIVAYFRTLSQRFGEGWTRFWFQPSDPRTLSLLRVLVGLVATATVASYGFDLLTFFGPDGLVPVAAVRGLQMDQIGDQLVPRFRFSYLDYVRTPSSLWAVHVAGVTVLVLFTLGVLARITSVLSFVVFLSYYHRGPMLISQFEPVLVFLLLYLCIGPSGAYYSIDRIIKRRRHAKRDDADRVPPSFTATIAVRLMQIHLCAAYVMMALSKTLGYVWWDGTAAWWLIINTQDTLVDLIGLRDRPYVVNFWTHAILAYELAFPVLAWNKLARPLLLSVGVVIWASVAVLTGLVTFAVTMVVAGFAFLAPEQTRALLGGNRRKEAVRATQPEVLEPSVAAR
jgi:hypothetical protein